jgi:hypothetical protein
MKDLMQLFVDWIKAKVEEDPMKILGEANDCTNCPLANFFQDTLEVHALVGEGEVTLSTHDWSAHVELPDWATRFINTIDTSQYHVEGHFVTADEARVAICRATGEEGPY